MKFGKFLIFLVALCIAGVFFMPVRALADYQAEKIKVKLERNFNIVVDGKKVVPKAPDGTILYPLSISSRSYLPVRYVAGISNCSVAWAAATNTISLAYDPSGQTVAVKEYTGGSVNKQPVIVSALKEKSFKIKLNEQEVEPLDDKGNRMYPITYKGWSYLPVRNIAELAGTTISWDHPSQTMTLLTVNAGAGASAAATNAGIISLGLTSDNEILTAVVVKPQVVQKVMQNPASPVIDNSKVVDSPQPINPSPVSPPVTPKIPVSSPIVPNTSTVPSVPMAPPVTPAKQTTASHIVDISTTEHALWTTITLKSTTDVFSACIDGEQMTYQGGDTYIYQLVGANTGKLHSFTVYNTDGQKLETASRSV